MQTSFRECRLRSQKIKSIDWFSANKWSSYIVIDKV